jgi:hypothetical protein
MNSKSINILNKAILFIDIEKFEIDEILFEDVNGTLSFVIFKISDILVIERLFSINFKYFVKLNEIKYGRKKINKIEFDSDYESGLFHWTVTMK